MLRTLRAFAWMRWRVLVNSLERTGARDTLERFSLAIEQLGPLLAAALLIPSALFLAALGAAAGYSLGTNGFALPAEIVRFALLAAVALSIAGPILLPAGERTNAVRLLLLPIERGVLYTAQALSSVADPWILLTIPILLFLPLGLASAGALMAAAVALVAGGLLLLILIALSALSTNVLHLLVRDRRRGEIIALVFIVVLPMIGMVPAMLSDDDVRRKEEQAGGKGPPAWVVAAGSRAFSLVPSELHRRAIRAQVDDAPGRGLAPLAGLVAAAAGLHSLGLLAFGAMLNSPGSSGPRRGAGGMSSWNRSFPGFSAGASAVAVNQWRLVARTPRGRSILVSPLLVFLVFGILMWRAGGEMRFGFMTLTSGLGLAIFGSAVSLMAILPFAMNQFAVDRAGLTLQLLAPLSDRDIVIGKALGNGLVSLASALLCVGLAFVAFPGGSLAVWLTLPFGLLATYLLAAPAAAALSAMFPRAVDLNSIGNGSNAHQAAGLLGMLAFVAAGVPPILLTLLATRLVDSVLAAPLLVAGWCAVAFLLSRWLMSVVAVMFAGRRENIGLVV